MAACDGRILLKVKDFISTSNPPASIHARQPSLARLSTTNETLCSPDVASTYHLPFTQKLSSSLPGGSSRRFPLAVYWIYCLPSSLTKTRSLSIQIVKLCGENKVSLSTTDTAVVTPINKGEIPNLTTHRCTVSFSSSSSSSSSAPAPSSTQASTTTHLVQDTTHESHNCMAKFPPNTLAGEFLPHRSDCAASIMAAIWSCALTPSASVMVPSHRGRVGVATGGVVSVEDL
ncbi:hypothetical protein Pelo_12706 [Pelomyxa schiedti]|nr:hypothetical protein Pelo_12706 [Pelomyxa schiedti]